MWRELDEAVCTFAGCTTAIFIAFVIGWVLDLLREVHRQFWPRDRYLSGCAFQLNSMRFAFEVKAVS